MRQRVYALLLTFSSVFAGGQASPYNISYFKPQSFTSTGQTGAVIQLNGLSAPTSTIGSSFASGAITVTGTGLTTATFAMDGSSDNGVTYFPQQIYTISATPASGDTATVTANSQFRVSLSGLTHVRFRTSSTFTAASLSIQLSASPNASLASLSNGGGTSGVSSFNARAGAVTPETGDYSFPLITGSLTPDQVASAGDLTNDTSGTAANASALAGVTITGTAAAAYVPVASSSTAGTFRRLTADDILPGFTINSFTGGSSVEIGASVVNPAFSASYSATPASAQITNTDGTDSPLTLTTPFTSGTVTGTFSKTTATATTFTLSATGSVTKTATQQIAWVSRFFGGVGAAGATSSVTASGTTAVLSNSAVLASLGLANSQVGGTYGPFTPSGQKVYLMLIGSSHTFKDSSTGFAFAFNAPTAITFVNANGATVSMYLYESTNTLSGSFTVQVVT